MYILEIDFTDSKYYIRDNQDGTWDEIYSPKQATQFNTKNEAIAWAKQNTTLSEYITAIEQTDKLVNEFDDWIKSGMVRRSFNTVDNKFSRPYNPTIDTKEDVLKWRVKKALSKDKSVRYEDYKTWPHLYSLYENLFEIQVYIVEPENQKYVTCSIRVRKDSKYKTFLSEIKLIEPYITYKDSDGNRMYNIISDDLAATMNAFIHIKDDTKGFIIDHRHEYILLGESTLEKCFEYIKNNLYYS